MYHEKWFYIVFAYSFIYLNAICIHLSNAFTLVMNSYWCVICAYAFTFLFPFNFLLRKNTHVRSFNQLTCCGKHSLYRRSTVRIWSTRKIVQTKIVNSITSNTHLRRQPYSYIKRESSLNFKE